MSLFIRWLINAVALMAATSLITGVTVRNFYIALVVALILGFLNAVVRPVLIFLTLPITLVTLGLFTFIINALIIWFVSSIIRGFDVAGFLPALALALFLWLISLLTNWLLRDGT